MRYLGRLELPAQLQRLGAAARGVRVGALLAQLRPSRTVLSIAGNLLLLAIIAATYEISSARVSEHRALLTGLVRSYTGLDVRFRELGLRWGWYGPEAVFREVQLGEPGRARPLLAAPELIVSFDLWSTVRRGDLTAARITLMSPDIDLTSDRTGDLTAPLTGSRRAAGASPGRTSRHLPLSSNNRRGASTGTQRAVTAPPAKGGELALLSRWHGGRVDIEGGSIRLQDPRAARGAEPLSLSIRSASLRRLDMRWSATGLFFLPEQLGRSARLSLSFSGDPAQPRTLAGQLRFSGTRLRLRGWREALAGLPAMQRFLPLEGAGDLDLTARFADGQVHASSGKAHLAGLTLVALPPPNAAPGAPREDSLLQLQRLAGQWQLHAAGQSWNLVVSGLDLGADVTGPARTAARLTLTGSAAGFSGGLFSGGFFSGGQSPRVLGERRLAGHLSGAPLGPVMEIARWLAPHLLLSGCDLKGEVRELSFDWDPARAQGAQLHTAAHLTEVSIAPSSHAFELGGLALEVNGSEDQLVAQGESTSGSLKLAQSAGQPLTGLSVSEELRVQRLGERWELSVPRLTLAREHTQLSLHGSLLGGLPGRPAAIAVQGELTGAAIPELLALAGDSTVRAFGAAAAQLTAGRIEAAQLLLAGPLDSQLLLADPRSFTGTLTVRDAVLSGGDLWPDVGGLAARVSWHGANIHAQLEGGGSAGPFRVESGQADWDALGQGITHVTSKVRGRIEDVLAWLHSHPQLAARLPQAQQLEATGNVVLDLDVRTRPGAAHGHLEPQAQVAAVVDQARLAPIAGLPPMEALHGTLKLVHGRLARSSFTGRWLGGPVSLRVSQGLSQGQPALLVSGRGVLDARQFTLGDVPQQAELFALAGTSDWSGELSFVAAHTRGGGQWRGRAETSLIGVASALPEPLTKPALTALPLRVMAEGGPGRATVRVSLGERLRGILALRQLSRERGESAAASGSPWSIERGDVRLGGGTVSLPREALLRVSGRAPRLELPPYIALWQQLRHSAQAPAVRAQLAAADLNIAGQHYAQARLNLERRDRTDALSVEAQGISGVAGWPLPEDLSASNPATLRFSRLTLPDVATPGEGAVVLAALFGTGVGTGGPAALHVTLDELLWAGHRLGTLSGSLTAQLPEAPGGAASLDIEDLALTGSSQHAQGALHCGSAQCRLTLTLNTRDAAASLRDFGFRPELSAARGTLSGELSWPPSVSLWGPAPQLAGLEGHVSLLLEDGVTQEPEAGDSGARNLTPFPLLAVPALVAAAMPAAAVPDRGARGGPGGGSGSDPGAGSGIGGAPETAATAVASPELHFSRLAGDFEVHGGEVRTSNLQFDGDAEILVRGRLGLLARDYDERAWILHGAERLPEALHRFGSTPLGPTGVASVWLGLRDLFCSSCRDSRRAALHLQGSWDAPIVSPE